MTQSSHTPVERSPASLVGQIIKDLRVVGDLQLRLAQAHVASELKRLSAALAVMALGGCMLGLFSILASMSLVHLLHWITSPTGNLTEWLPLWSCFAIAATATAIIGTAMILIGMRQFRVCSRFTPSNAPKE